MVEGVRVAAYQDHGSKQSRNVSKTVKQNLPPTYCGCCNVPQINIVIILLSDLWFVDDLCNIIYKGGYLLKVCLGPRGLYLSGTLACLHLRTHTWEGVRKSPSMHVATARGSRAQQGPGLPSDGSLCLCNILRFCKSKI